MDKTKQQSTQFLDHIADRATSAHYNAIGALATFNEQFEQAIVASTGPRYWGFASGRLRGQV